MSPGDAPNLVLVILDTLTADAAGLGRSPAPMPTLQSLADQARRAATHAFSRSFLVAAGLAFAALVPLLVARGRREGS